MTFEDLEVFYRDYKNGIITLEEWNSICFLGLQDIMKENEEVLKRLKEGE